MSGRTAYTVYEHWRPDTGVCFYVGKGKRSRHLNMIGRNRWHKNVRAKLLAVGLDVEVRIIAKGLTNEDAIIIEKQWIAFYGRENLVNLTDGGEGTEGRILSHESREKLRRASTGKRCSEETRRKLSLLNTGIKRNPERIPAPPKPCQRFAKGHVPHNKGKSLDVATRHKISQSLTGRAGWGKGKKYPPQSEKTRRKKTIATTNWWMAKALAIENAAIMRLVQ